MYMRNLVAQINKLGVIIKQTNPQQMKFRLNKIQVDDDNYQTDQIELVNHKNDKRPNHFSLIVGNNGTGKSRLLGSIARVLNGNFN